MEHLAFGADRRIGLQHLVGTFDVENEEISYRCNTNGSCASHRQRVTDISLLLYQSPVGVENSFSVTQGHEVCAVPCDFRIYRGSPLAKLVIAPSHMKFVIIASEAWLKVKGLCGLIRLSSFDTSTEEGRSKERLRRMALTAATAAMMKVMAMALPLITISLALPYMGKEVFGLWMTVIGFFQLFVFADFGLGNGLLTTLSQAFGKGDLIESRKLTSSAFFLLIGVAVAILCLFCLLYSFIPWARLLNAETDATIRFSAMMVAAVFVPRILQLPFALVEKSQLAVQEGYRTNLWQCCAYLISAICVVVIAHWELGVLTLVFAVAAVPAVFFFLNWCHFFLIDKPELRPTRAAASPHEASHLMRLGGAYFVLSILTTFGLAFDNVIVAQACGLDTVAEFSVVARVATLLTVALGMICMPMWSANGEAIARGDYAWVKRTTARIVQVTSGLAIVGGICLVAVGPLVFHAWLGPSFNASRWLLAGLAAQNFVLAVAAPYFMVLNAAGNIGVQIQLFLLFTPVALGLKFVMASMYGSVGVPWAMSICYGIMVLPWIWHYVKHRVYDVEYFDGRI